MLYLGEQDLDRAVSCQEVMAAIEHAFRVYSSGLYDMPPRMHVHNQGNTLLYMPCFTESMFGTKMLTLFPGNAAHHQPVIEGLMLLNDAETGKPLALLNGARLTAIRTGAVGGVAVRHTSHYTAKSVGLIGAGVQGYYQLLFAAQARELEQIHIFDINKQSSIALMERLSLRLPHTSIKTADTVDELLAASEIVITATSAQQPVLPDCADQLRGRHFIGIGSYKPEMREFPEALYRLVGQVIVDTEHGLHESGDLITPLQQGWIQEDQVFTFGELLVSGDTPKCAETTLFKTVGMALFDLVVGKLIYHKALEKGIGQKIDY